MVQNEAAWITSPSEYPFTVKEGPKPTAGAGEIVIKNAAVSIVRSPILMPPRSLFHV
ncbi:zinc-binding oxidoreductase CipB [Ilyonectria robusta]